MDKENDCLHLRSGTILHLSSHLVYIILYNVGEVRFNWTGKERCWSKRWELKITVVCSKLLSRCYFAEDGTESLKKNKRAARAASIFLKILISGVVVTECTTKKTTRSPKIFIFNIYEKCAPDTRGFYFTSFRIWSCRIYYVKWLVLQLRKRRESFFQSLNLSLPSI